MSTLYPRVGVGVILTNAQGQVLLGKRKGSHAPYWSIPGGHLELGESFESAAIREVAEETGLEIHGPEVVAVTNNLETWCESGLHYITVTLHAKADGEPNCWSRRSAKAGSGAIRARCPSPTSTPAVSPSPAGWRDAAICRVMCQWCRPNQTDCHKTIIALS